MNYYDEEIVLNGPESRSLSQIKVDRLPSSSSGRAIGALGAVRTGTNDSTGRTNPGRQQRNLLQEGHSADDDGLLRDIIDHDDDDDDDDEDDSEMQPAPRSTAANNEPLAHGNATLRPQTRTGSTRNIKRLAAKSLDHGTENSESDSDEATMPQPHGEASSNADVQLSITPDKWEGLAVHAELKELFPYILKYTPQHIETPYHLQPFIPEYVPAVGDVDAFLKVTTPPLLQLQRQHEMNEHLRKMGLYFLDEPSGEQSEPSLLNMKLRSVLTGSGVNPRSASAALIPIAKSAKDIDKWINEVEQVHMAQTVNDTQPRKDIEPLLLDWPRAYADAAVPVQEAYQRCLQDEDIAHYVRVLCQYFEVEGPAETQADYILNVQTLFALYLAANQAWE